METYAVLALLVPLLHLCWLDYKAFLALGPGGTPPTLSGYLRVKTLGLFALQNPHKPGPTPRELQGTAGHLQSLPRRKGSKPVTKGIAPHRQVTQRAGLDAYRLLEAAIHRIGQESEWLHIGTSCFEKHGTGLFSRSPTQKTCLGEICHTHPSDGSMHLTLHPKDVKIVLEAGWGERHPLARGGWFERFVPAGFMMIYAPTTPKDVEVLMEIVEAAVWFVSGRKVARRGGREVQQRGYEVCCAHSGDQGQELQRHWQ